MLTRRTATVTISAPDASRAAAFCSNDLYLPVPTIRRERNVRPATVQLSSSMCTCPSPRANSASADEGDDLEIVAVLDRDGREGRARDDLEVALDRDARRRAAGARGGGGGGRAPG